MPPEEIAPGAVPAAEPVVTSTPEAAPVVETAVVETAAEPVAEVIAPEADKPALHTDTETLLETVTKKPEPEAKVEETKEGEKPAETKPEDKPAEIKAEDKAAEAAVEAAAPEPIVYEEFTLPDGVKPDADKMAIYRDVARELRLPQEGAQKLLNLHAEAIQAYANNVATEQHRVFGDMRGEWRKQVMADDELGGAGHQTAMKAVARARDALISSARPGTPEFAAHEKEFNDMLRITGAGDHPAMLRLLHNAARRFDEPAMPPTGVRPPPNNGKPPGRQGIRGMYKKAVA